jgi:uncharacterized protein YecE (DUF72 family)
MPRKKGQQSHTPRSPKWRIGTSGWGYPHWKRIFYPSDVARSKWLDFYGNHFDTVEVNATFYRLPGAKTFHEWYRRTPENFLWSVKASKYLTHTKRLKDPEEPLSRLYEAAQGLKEKLGPILFQLPPSLSFDRDLFISFCESLGRSNRHVLEIRHKSWIHHSVFEILKENNIAFCISDTAGRYPYHEEITADFLYIRLHGSQKLYASEYSEAELQAWARKIRDWSMDTYAYFDNDFQGYAVENAKRLKKILSIG